MNTTEPRGLFSLPLCRMDIAVDQAQEAEDGEEVLGRAGKLEVKVGLKRVTRTATRISVRVQEDFFSRDKATAREIIRQTAAIAEDLESPASRKALEKRMKKAEMLSPLFLLRNRKRNVLSTRRLQLKPTRPGTEEEDDGGIRHG